MQRTTRTIANQTTRSNANQTNRTASGQTRASSSQINRATGGQQGGVGSQQTSASQNANKQKPSKQSEPKDRLGQAVVAMIFGIFGLILFIVTWLKMDYDSTHSYTISAGTAITAFFAFIFNVAGFILGIRARRSSKGRGMAIAGITLTAIPFVLITLFLVISVVGYFVMWH